MNLALIGYQALKLMISGSLDISNLVSTHPLCFLRFSLVSNVFFNMHMIVRKFKYLTIMYLSFKHLFDTMFGTL